MNRILISCQSCIVPLVVVASLMGCSAEQKPAATTAEPYTEPGGSSQSPNLGGDALADAQDLKIKEALAALSPEDRALATRQRTCPVTDEFLGSMGSPVKVTVKGRDVFVCCAGCIDELKKEFAKYEKKLPEKS